MTLAHEIETISFVFVASMVATVAIGLMHHPSPPPQHFSVATPFANLLPTVTPTPTPALVPEVTYLSQTSSDGKEKVNMKQVDVQGMKTYTFTLTETEKNITTPLFTQHVATESSMQIPFNTFSPNNSYLFLERKDGETHHYLVFQTSGAAFGGKQYIDATDAFTSYTSTYTHPVATGWADNALLIVNAKDANGQGVSYWLDLSSQSFIRLSNYFP